MYAGERKRMASWLDVAGPEWFLRRSGLDWREDDRPLATTTVHVAVGEADSLEQETLADFVERLSKANWTCSKARLVMIDPPFGLNMHKNSAVPTPPWDLTAWGGEEFVKALKAGQEAGLIDSSHILIYFHTSEMNGDIMKSLRAAGYSNFQHITFVKEGHRRWVVAMGP